MQRKILLIHDKRASWFSAANNSRREPIGFHWFKALINSQHNHKIRILVVDYERDLNPSVYKLDEFFVHRIVGYIEEYKEYHKLRDSCVEVFFSDDVLSVFSEKVQNEIKYHLKHRNDIILVDPFEFFINAVNDGFEIFF